ncbi:MAG: BREX-3 system P-loop-containing protein BrxF [Anaerocolumna aminovalerica]|jgi:hypothetical protein|uniref:BREX-3 system P-loop-containing protein BrxF n=1 Tax=Anaerocolumna aminovalerica TaxID=1527 RepID=UPI002910C2A4|nr:BREX-3 system P-loop-containing protein BrxF [Anaerocolumna aminovalerica]MDU6263680.1 BREX-3 system P-loop-containing protein BrxF [Anaerocolumna aminovalerica]
MGAIIQARDFSPEKHAGLLKPIIYCCPYGNVESEAISINVLLAEKLVKFRPNRRTMRLEHCFSQVLDSLPDGVIIKDFDVMFNPEYQVDLLKLMVTVCKKKPFSIIWPGKCDDGMLFYAEEGYQDYKLFSIEDYDVTCIV